MLNDAIERKNKMKKNAFRSACLQIEDSGIQEVNQCDFFTIHENSPAAKLGFANITKLSKWTPGCVMDDQIEGQQFYHW